MLRGTCEYTMELVYVVNGRVYKDTKTYITTAKDAKECEEKVNKHADLIKGLEKW